MFTDDTREEAYEEMEKPPLPKSSIFRIRLNTFRDLWRRGYYLTCGLKFGCDYLAYESVPGEVSICCIFLYCSLFIKSFFIE